MTTLYETEGVRLVRWPEGLALFVGDAVVWSSCKLRNGKVFPIAEATRAYLAGATLKEISKRTGYSHSNVWKHLKLSGMQMRSRGPTRKQA